MALPRCTSLMVSHATGSCRSKVTPNSFSTTAAVELFLALSVTGHVDADDLDNRMSVTLRTTSVLTVELVVDSTGARDLVVMYVRPTILALGLSALEPGNAAQKRLF